MFVMKPVPSENLIKLRKLNEKLCFDYVESEDYKEIVKEIKEAIDYSKSDIETLETSQSKIKCYEGMCSKITTILNKLKHI